MKKAIVTISLLIISLTVANSQVPDKKQLTGSWLGKLEASALPIRIIFNLSIIEKDSLVATLDSPDQGVKGIKIGPVILNGNEINIKAPILLGEYKGTLVNDTTMTGTWSQRGASLPLGLTRLEEVFSLKRPQEPKAPFQYISEDVIFTNNKFNINLAGTLTIPDGPGPFPAVILITGSGPQNRDEELLGHKPFLVIADHLTRNGIAVLRYDDRGFGKSQGNAFSSTSADLATDAEAALEFLKKDKRIDPGKIGLAGHSEGGLIAPIVASFDAGVAFIISLAGPGVNGEKIILRQSSDISRAMNIDEKDILEGNKTNSALFKILRKETDNDVAEVKMREAYKKILVKKKMSPVEVDNNLNQFQASFNKQSYTWFRYFVATDPAIFWKKVKCPVLALNGEKDLQVAWDVNLPAIENAVRAGGNMNVKVRSFPEHNHLFQHSQTGLPREYGEIEETFSPEVLKLMTDWINDLR